ncbi:phosphotransferase [Nonomuraea sp. K274]|uniref:Phosphotransferase n=1 Tax=Nonomuraea cypriaca TaxID=1187855 RepID=A0A931A8W6_9ACTN|nr:phosphotransferase [Nonomuraea cypriaca]MBF8186804.1 phosphotransferase [Nonomuraea cypriaca]
MNEWCERWLGATPVGEIFRAGHLSAVRGVELSDGRRVVLKFRPPVARVRGCVDVQRRLAAAGFPCPAPLAGPSPVLPDKSDAPGGHSGAPGLPGSPAPELPGGDVDVPGEWLVTAEEYVPGGGQLDPATDRARPFAAALARLVRLAPRPAAVSSLAPAPPWLGWDHGGPEVWPWPDDLDVDLNAHPGPGRLDELGARVRERLLATSLPSVIGHGDFESQNVRWLGGALHAVHDWDSVVALPEAAVAGAAAAVFTETGASEARATVEESARFLECYMEARGADWGREEREVAWAAGLWVRAFNAKKAAVAGHDLTLVDLLAQQLEARLRQSGA